MPSSFKFYLSNLCSNEKVSETKVEDLKILNNFRIQNFSSCHPKVGEKEWIPKCVGQFQMHSSFKFYPSNHSSNEKVLETKVVDLKILNKFGV